jgi:peptide/nickel transport system ATP-binding protein
MAPQLTPPLLRLRDLTVSYGPNPAVQGVSFDLAQGESLALIGESGSGKSTTARALLRLLPERAKVTGRVEIDGQEVLGLSERAFRPHRGATLGFVPQDPAHALNPVRKIGAQALEVASREEILETFAKVGLDHPARVFDAWPHELSGGMLQRVLIGLTILPRPRLLIADEPTSALDVTIQKRILDLLSRLQADLGIGLLLITHDLALAAERTQKLIVLKAGRIEEAGETARVFAAPASAYAAALHADVPALNPDRHADLRDAPRALGPKPRIEVRGLAKAFGGKPAVENVSFSVASGTTHALVGESGSGKTTTIRLLMGLETPDRGTIHFSPAAPTLRDRWRQMQLVYQNPYTSLDPSWRVAALIREPLDRFGIADAKSRMAEALEAVRLSPRLLTRRAAELSGGQRQRVAIARALALRPEVLVLDEPTSALDVSVQAGIVETLMRLQADLGLTYVFVSHDLALVRQMAHRISVLHRGRVVEDGAVAEVFARPAQAYTRSLLQAIPRGVRAAA